MIVKSEKGQKVVKEFEVYFDDDKSVPILAKMLESEYADGNRNWAVFNLDQFSRAKLVTLLEEQIKSGSERQRVFAGQLLSDIRAGNFGPNL